MPLQATSGAASYDGFGGGVPFVPTYIEDVFSTYLYTGNGSTQTITNGIDLSGKGGLVWTKTRSSANSHNLFDSTRALNQTLSSNTTQAQQTINNGNPLTFNTNGFSLPNSNDVNVSGTNYASWTFREQPKFFDVVTYTGNGANRTISHNLGSVPGCIIVKRTDAAADWQVYHRSSGNNKYLVLNSTGDEITSSTRWNDTTPTSTVFSLGTDTTVNANGGTYVAYLFAHDAGGFGLSGTDNVITCGGYTGNGSATGPTITLGYEPQWLLIKNSGNSPFNWQVIDNMRGMPVGSADANLQPNLSNAESSTEYVTPTATGFQITSSSGQVNGNGNSHIYIAIRRGPMKTPTSGTSVFSPISATTVSGVQTTGFPVDTQFARKKAITYSGSFQVMDRLRGVQTTTGAVSIPVLQTASSAAETTQPYTNSWSNTGFTSPGEFGGAGDAPVFYSFRRAPGFFDVVCYTGNGVNRDIPHNLGVVPELIIVKLRAGTSLPWMVYQSDLGTSKYLNLDNNIAADTNTSIWRTSTATTFGVGVNGNVNTNSSAYTYVAYLFASLPGVSKVGLYWGTGTTQQIDCGFTGGARFVLIKRTDNTGDWYVWDSARGIVSGNDPYLLLNSTAAEVTNTDYIDTYSAGFEISSTAPAAINAVNGNYIFLAIA